jgi:hypothetical protein
MNKKQKKEKEFEPEFDSDDEEGIAEHIEKKRLVEETRLKNIKRNRDSLRVNKEMMKIRLEGIEQQRQALILEQEQELILAQQQELILEQEHKYILFGHGLITSADRLEIPNGRRLVMTALCGDTVNEYRLEKTEANFFKELLDPLQMNEIDDAYYDTWHGEDIIVRNSGSDITDSNISLLLFYTLKNGSIMLCTSGIYEYEKTGSQLIDRFNLGISKHGDTIITRNDVLRIFKTSLYPTLDVHVMRFHYFKIQFEKKFPQKSLIGIINDLPPNSMLIASSCRIFDNSALSLDEQNEAKDNSFDRGERNNRKRRVGKGLRKTRRKYNMPRSRRSIKRKRKTLAFRKTRKH